MLSLRGSRQRAWPLKRSMDPGLRRDDGFTDSAAYSPKYAACTRESCSISSAFPVIVIIPESIT
jgi:hypothetical protein